MTSRLTVFSAFTVFLIFAAGSVSASPPASLRTNVVVESDSVRLSDLFNGAGAHGDKVVAYAPAPGRKLVLEATWLYRVARAYRVRWRPASRFDRTIVERRSQIIGTDQIIDTLTTALRSETDLQAEVEIELDNRLLQFFLPSEVPGTVTSRSISYNSRTGRFTAVLTAPDDSAEAARFTVTGSAHKLVQVPTLAQRLYPDDVISERDILWKPMRVNRLDPRTVLNASKITGMSPRRPIIAGRAIMTTEIQSPTLVRRGKQVTIHLQTKNMTLSALGKSLQTAGKGDVVRVQNLESGKTIEAIVTGPEAVTVTLSGALALN